MSDAVKKAMEAAEVSYVPEAVKAEKVAEKAAPVEETGGIDKRLKQFSKERFKKEGNKSAAYMIANIINLTADLTRDVEGGEALAAMATLKRMSASIDNMSDDVVPYANKEFSEGASKFDDFNVKKYTPKKVWKYSEEVENMEEELKVKRDMERKDGTALDVSKPFDALKSKMFSISLK